MKKAADAVDQRVSTGPFPSWDEVESAARDAHSHAREQSGGERSTAVPELSEADADAMGLCVAGTDGQLHPEGDADVQFSIQSISKVFVYALVCEELGHDAVREQVGVNNTGMPFDSVMAIEVNNGHPMNPMVNAGAIATTAMVPGSTPREQWQCISHGLSEFAGRDLEVDEEVYGSETQVNQRNQALARLLQSYDKLHGDPLEISDIYTRQCSLNVTAKDLAVMGATLADGGVNPITGTRVVSAQVCHDVMAIMASSGMYERSGEWLFEIGIPAKSGVSGGIVAVAPGKCGIGVYAPPLDEAGNSVRGQYATAYLSRALGLDLFATTPSRRD